MALTVELWEDSGTLSVGRGTIIQEVDNLGFKNSSLDETTTFADFPIRRPINTELFTTSYKKYYHFKFYGTYTNLRNVSVLFEGDPEGSAGTELAGKVRILYKWSNVYATPDTTLLDGITYDPTNPPIWTPKLSTTGPNAATSYIDPVANTTYYTQFLITQLYIDKSSGSDFGNLKTSFKLKLVINELKSGLPGFDTDFINWNP